jgi:hypothetical protein
MNSWSKHIPKAVGALGAVFLAYSMYMFFRRPEIVVPPPVKAHTPPQAVEVPPTKQPKYVPKSWNPAPVSNPQNDRALQDRRNSAMRMEKDRLEAKMLIPRDYLKGARLKMFLPEELEYARNKNEGMEMLMGVRDGKPELMIAYGRQKMTPDQARHELEDQMGFYGVDITKQDTANNRNLGPTTTFKGRTKDGEDVQAEYFYNPKTGNSHMVLMMGRELSRQPARTRQIFDSLNYER